MRYVFALLAVVMILFVGVQYNDPDGPLWMVYYGVPVIWCALAAFRPGILANGPARALLAATVVAAVALTIWYWPPVSGFWYEKVWRMGMVDPEAAKIAEQSREGMGLMLATMVLIAVFVASFSMRLRSTLHTR